jgi:hypothetical protein
MRPNVTARLKNPLLCLAALLAWSLAVLSAARAADDLQDVPPVLSDSADGLPTAIIEDRIILAPDAAGFAPAEVLPGGSVVSADPVHEVIAPPPGLPTTEPRVLDVSSRVAEGMLIDEFEVDEMPFEASSGRWFQSGGWYLGGESLWMSRSIVERRTVGIDLGGGPIGIAASQYKNIPKPFGVAPGARVTLGKSLGRDYLDRDRFMEFVYYGGFAFNSQAGWNSIDGANSIVSPLSFKAPGFNGASLFGVQTDSGFNSWEWNYKLHRRLGRDQLVLSPNGNWTKHAERGWLPALILGIRLAQTNENFRLTSARANVPPSTFSGRYDISTDNWLLGLNIGGELISQNEFFYWGIRGRAAPAISFADVWQQAYGVNTQGTEINGTLRYYTDFTQSGRGSGAAFIGDLTLLAGWHIKPNFSLQLGYDFLWLAGIATADRQYNLANIDTGAVNLGGQAFLNGLSFGFNGSW